MTQSIFNTTCSPSPSVREYLETGGVWLVTVPRTHLLLQQDQFARTGSQRACWDKTPHGSQEQSLCNLLLCSLFCSFASIFFKLFLFFLIKCSSYSFNSVTWTLSSTSNLSHGGWFSPPHTHFPFSKFGINPFI